jgi:hypothetical protein
MSTNWDESPADDDEWDDDNDTSETLACPLCGADVYEDAIRCPNCGEYITHSTSFFAGRPWWWIALGIAGVLAVIVMSLIAGFGS